MQKGRMTIGVELFADHFFGRGAHRAGRNRGRSPFCSTRTLRSKGGAAAGLVDEGTGSGREVPAAAARLARAGGADRAHAALQRQRGRRRRKARLEQWHLRGDGLPELLLGLCSAELPFALGAGPTRPGAAARPGSWSRAATTRRGTSGPTAARALIPSTSSPTAGRRCKSCRGRT